MDSSGFLLERSPGARHRQTRTKGIGCIPASIRWMLGLAIIGALAVVNVYAQAIPEPVHLDPSLDRIDLSSSAWVLEDPGGKLTLEDVQNPKTGSQFQPGLLKSNISASAYWLRFKLQNSLSDPMSWTFDTGNRTLQEIDLFVQNADGSYQHQTAGSTRPFAERRLPTASFAFPIHLASNRSADVYLRVRSTGYLKVMVAPRLWQPVAYGIRAGQEKTQWLVYVGMAIAMGLFNLLLYFSIRDVNYLYYVMSLLSIVWVVSSAQGGYGSAFEYLWPNSPLFEQTAWTASIMATSTFPSLFILRFSGFKKSMPRMHKVLTLCALVLAIVIGCQIGITTLQIPGTARVLQLFFLAGQIPFVLLLSLAIFGLIALTRSGNRQALFICIAWSPIILAGVLVTALNLLGKDYPQSMPMWASAFELILMSLALVDRLYQERREKARAQLALVEGLQQSERELEGKVAQRTQELHHEQTRTKDLLHNMLPVEIAEELSSTGSTKPARHESTTILFTDFSGFTQAVSTMPADRMVAELNEIFAAFDDITDECGVEKIKTIGDAYMAAAGLPKPCGDHAQRCVRAGLRMVDFLEQRNQRAPFKWQVRVGIHSGPVVAGVVGKRKYAFDIWGDSVNVASRMESSGEAGRVNVSAYTYDLIQSDFACEYRGKVDAKGKGSVDMYFVTGAAQTA